MSIYLCLSIVDIDRYIDKREPICPYLRREREPRRVGRDPTSLLCSRFSISILDQEARLNCDPWLCSAVAVAADVAVDIEVV